MNITPDSSPAFAKASQPSDEDHYRSHLRRSVDSIVSSTFRILDAQNGPSTEKGHIITDALFQLMKKDIQYDFWNNVREQLKPEIAEKVTQFGRSLSKEKEEKILNTNLLHGVRNRGGCPEDSSAYSFETINPYSSGPNPYPKKGASPSGSQRKE